MTALTPVKKKRPPRKKPGLKDQVEPSVIREMAERGMNLETLATMMGTTKQNLSYAIRTTPELKQAYNEGMLSLFKDCTDCLRDAIRGGQWVPAVFLLKSKFGFVEEQFKKGKDLDDTPKVCIYLPDNQRSSVENKDIHQES